MNQFGFLCVCMFIYLIIRFCIEFIILILSWSRCFFFSIEIFSFGYAIKIAFIGKLETITVMILLLVRFWIKLHMIGSWIITLNFITTSWLTIFLFYFLFMNVHCSCQSLSIQLYYIWWLATFVFNNTCINKILFLEIILLIVMILIWVACNWYWIITFNWIAYNIISGWIGL
jgi:hypothetical protein